MKKSSNARRKAFIVKRGATQERILAANTDEAIQKFVNKYGENQIPIEARRAVPKVD